jgi:hypothetical protein
MSKYTIVKDTSVNEYALLYKENFGKVLKDTHKVWAEGQKDMGPEHLFWNGGKKIKPLNLKGMDQDTLNIGVPIVHFYKDKKVYETAMYAGEIAYKRYQVIKDVTTEDQFFKYVEARS